MLNIIYNPLSYIFLGFLYLAMAIFFIGCAKHNNIFIQSVGILIGLLTLIISGFQISWWFPLIAYVFAFLTQTTIPEIIGFIYWKVRYNPRFLTKRRFGGLVFEQYQRAKELPLLTQLFVDKGTEEGLAGREDINLYVKELLEKQSKYVVEEVLGDYKLFKHYIHIRSTHGLDPATTTIWKDLGIIPVTALDFALEIDDLNERLNNMSKKQQNN